MSDSETPPPDGEKKPEPKDQKTGPSKWWGAVIVGILGTAFWEVFLAPFVDPLRRGSLGVLSGGWQNLTDAIYKGAANYTDWVFFLVAGILALALWMIVSDMPRLMRAARDPKKSRFVRQMNSLFLVGHSLIFLILAGTGWMALVLSPSIHRDHEALMVIAGAYMTDQEVRGAQHDWLLVDSEARYRSHMADLEGVVRTRSATPHTPRSSPFPRFPVDETTYRRVLPPAD